MPYTPFLIQEISLYNNYYIVTSLILSVSAFLYSVSVFTVVSAFDLSAICNCDRSVALTSSTVLSFVSLALSFAVISAFNNSDIWNWVSSVALSVLTCWLWTWSISPFWQFFDLDSCVCREATSTSESLCLALVVLSLVVTVLVDFSEVCNWDRRVVLSVSNLGHWSSEFLSFHSVSLSVEEISLLIF